MREPTERDRFQQSLEELLSRASMMASTFGDMLHDMQTGSEIKVETIDTMARLCNDQEKFVHGNGPRLASIIRQVRGLDGAVTKNLIPMTLDDAEAMMEES